MSELHEKELSLLEEEHRNRYSSLSVKYADLLSANRELQNKFIILERLYDDSIERKPESEGKPESVREEM